MNSTARKTTLGALLLVIVGAVVIGFILFAPRGGSALGLGAGARLRDYLGQQVVAIVNAHLEPQVSFQTLDYEAPFTVKLSSVHLTAPDGTRVLEVDQLHVRLAEVPSINKPIRISEVTIEGGDIRIVQDPLTGKLLGFSQIAKVHNRADLESVPEQQRLSSVLVLERVAVHDVGLTYDDGSGDPMTLRGFNSTLDIKPASEGPGWYELDAQAGRLPGLQASLKGAFNIDEFLLQLADSKANITLNEQTLESLPPQIQSVLRGLEAAGAAEFAFRGRVPLQAVLQSDVTGTLALRGFSVAVSDYRIPIQRAQADVRMAESRLTVSNVRAEALDGVVTAHAEADLSSAGFPTLAEWNLDNLDLREALRTSVPAGEMPKLAGKLTGLGSAALSLNHPLATIDGVGEAHIRDGRLLVLPGLGQIVQQIGNLDFSGDSSYGHEADAQFKLEPGGVRITESSVLTGIMAADAHGLVGYDGSLDLSVRAGPLKKLAKSLGLIGKAIGNLTERLVGYHVQGTIDAPDVTVMPLGIGG